MISYFILKNKKLQNKEMVRIFEVAAERNKFMNTIKADDELVHPGLQAASFPCARCMMSESANNSPHTSVLITPAKYFKRADWFFVRMHM